MAGLLPNSNPQLYPSTFVQNLKNAPREIEKTTSETCIVGLRVWKLVDDRGLPKLNSVSRSTIWPYRKALEKDPLDDLGIHATKTGRRSGPSVWDPAAICGQMDIESLFREYEADIAGEVYLWGHVDEFELGYTAEFAYPKKLYPHSELDPVIAMQLEDEYGVPCEYRPEFVKAKREILDFSKYAVGGPLPQTTTATAASAMQMMGMQQVGTSSIYYGRASIAALQQAMAQSYAVMPQVPQPPAAPQVATDPAPPSPNPPSFWHIWHKVLGPFGL